MNQYVLFSPFPITNFVLFVRLSGMARTARNDLDTAMLQFEQLINNKWFLLTFIETLERQKSFSVEDRMNTASLIMIILMTKMEYCTDILRCGII